MRAINILFGANFSGITAYLQNHASARQRIRSWLGTEYKPKSIGDALAAAVLERGLGDEVSASLKKYLAACRVANGYRPIPAKDDRWGMVDPMPDVFSTSQGLLLASTISTDAVISDGCDHLVAMVEDTPWNKNASDTLPQYRKLSEILLQSHYCATVAVIAGGDNKTRLLQVAEAGYKLALRSEYALRFMSPLFRIVTMTASRLFASASELPSKDVLSAVKRLLVDNGALEYRIEDKVDERAGSRTRSINDQQFAWTYSTAYGLLVCKTLQAESSSIKAVLAACLEERLQRWPASEEPMRIKQYINALAESSSAYALLAALAAL
jgi:hypothetical protein